MKIFSADELHKIERATIEKEGISASDLIERGASAVACEIISRWRPNRKIIVFAGPGTNGATALAVGRQLIEQGYHLEVFLINIGGDKLNAECREMRDRLMTYDDTEFTEFTATFDAPNISRHDIVIDGLFGSGLKEPIQSGFAALVRYINESGAYIVSIDVPSGLFLEWNSSNERNNIIHANLTLTFQFPRLSFFFAENADFVGEWKVLDIELDEESVEKAHTFINLVGASDIRHLLKPRAQFCDKNDFGRLQVIAGSYGMMGAAILCTKGALRTGCGTATLHSPLCGMIPAQSALPEAMFEADHGDIRITSMLTERTYSAIAIGPGIGTHEDTINALEQLLLQTKSPLVLDADALNCIAERPTLLSEIPPMSVLTPHKREFDRMFGTFYYDELRLKEAMKQAEFFNIIIVLKGRYTFTVFPNGYLYINSSGNPGLATAGSGDVLTGIIASLTAQGIKPEHAAIAGTYIHGLAGDIATRRIGEYSVMASDIISEISTAIKSIISSTTLL